METKRVHIHAPLSTLGRAQAADEGRSTVLHETLLTTAGIVGAVKSVVVDSTVLQQDESCPKRLAVFGRHICVKARRWSFVGWHLGGGKGMGRGIADRTYFHIQCRLRHERRTAG